MPPKQIQCRRIYDPPRRDDGMRVLVDRLWPRGVRKDEAQLDRWDKELAPSNELRKTFHADAIDFNEFSTRYREELAECDDAINALLEEADGRTLTLLYAATNTEQNHANVLRSVLRGGEKLA